MNEYVPGNVVRCSVTFTDSVGAALDPTTVSCTVTAPETLPVTYVYGTDVELVKDSVGNYHIDLTANTQGIWYYRFFSTGIGTAAFEDKFGISESSV